MNKKTFTMTLTADEIASIAMALQKTATEKYFNQCGDFSKIIPASCETLESLSKKFWEVFK